MRKVDKIVGLAQRHDVIMLQEVHGCNEDIAELQCRLPRHLIFGSFCENRNAGGVLVILKPSLVSRYSFVERSVICRGRALVVTLRGAGKHPLAICCLHVVPEWSVPVKISFIDQVRAATPEVGEACLILGGDLNFTAAGEGRMEVDSGRVALFDEGVSSHFDDDFWQLTEVACDKPTRRGTVGGGHLCCLSY